MTLLSKKLKPLWLQEVIADTEKFHQLSVSIEGWANDAQIGGDTTAEMRAFIDATKKLKSCLQSYQCAPRWEFNRWDVLLVKLKIWSDSYLRWADKRDQQKTQLLLALQNVEMRYAIMYPQIADNDWLKDKLV